MKNVLGYLIVLIIMFLSIAAPVISLTALTASPHTVHCWSVTQGGSIVVHTYKKPTLNNDGDLVVWRSGDDEYPIYIHGDWAIQEQIEIDQ